MFSFKLVVLLPLFPRMGYATETVLFYLIVFYILEREIYINWGNGGIRAVGTVRDGDVCIVTCTVWNRMNGQGSNDIKQVWI